ncbi:MAG: hypothetical protein O3B73_07240 [bacterium]|nr:hypothetical protein [bacterium]
MDQATYNRQVDARAKEVLEAMAARGANGTWAAHAVFATGADRSGIHEAVVQSLGDFTLGLTGAGPFQILPAMLLLCRWERELQPETVELIRQFFTEGILERGNTENHWMMFYTGTLLAAERFADEPAFWNGQSPTAVKAEATRWILGTIERTARIGHHEYDSPGYHAEHFTPLVGLFEHAQDRELRQQVEKVLTLLVADMALEYYKGSWAGGHSREGYRQNTWTHVGPIQTVQYMYFGGEPFDAARHLQGFSIPVAAAAYRPPALFERLALDRSTPHVVKKTKAPRTIFRHVDRETTPVRKYTYMSTSFALGSSQLGLTAPAGPIDLVSWDLTWSGDKHQAKIGCNHPYADGGRFSAFLNPLPQDARRAIGGDKPYLQRPDRLFGASPFEQMMQHEGTAILLYRIPEGDDHPFVNVYLPTSVNWVAQGGWLFGDLGTFYVALRPLGDYAWERIRESANDNIMVSEGGLIDNWLLRIDDLNAGLVLEAVEAKDANAFADFCDRRSELDLDLSDWPTNNRVGVQTIGGARLEMVYDGAHTVDGQAIDYTAWPLYGAPGAHGEVNTGKVVFRAGQEEVSVDFGIDPKKPLMPMRVIG